jgi:hypothetical protein
MSEITLHESFRLNERLSTLLSHFVVSAMIACAVIAGVQFAERLVPAWDGDYLVAVCFFVALEALYAKRVARPMGVFSRQWFVYRITEWIVILVVLKVIVLLVRDVPVAADRAAGQNPIFSLLQAFQILRVALSLGLDGFASAIFNAEYIVAITFVVTSWVVSGLFADDLAHLESAAEIADDERLRLAMGDRVSARDRLVQHIFFVGAGLLVLSGLLGLDLGVLGLDSPISRPSVLNLLIYFLLGFVLLSQSRLAILRLRWVQEKTAITGNLAVRWTIYSLVFFVGLGLVASRLPTRFPVDLPGVLGWLINGIAFLAELILVLLALPLIYLLNLLSQLLLGRPSAIEPPQVRPPPALAPAAPPPASWLDLLVSVLFWCAIVAVLAYCFRLYFRQNQEALAALRRLPIWMWLARAWRGLRVWLGRLGRGVAHTLDVTRLMRRVRPLTAPIARPLLRLGRLSPRERVMFYYLAMVRRGGEAGIARGQSQTPYEYASTLRAARPDVADDVAGVTGEFVEARYSRHAITTGAVNFARRCWDRIRRALRRTVE